MILLLTDFSLGNKSESQDGFMKPLNYRKMKIGKTQSPSPLPFLFVENTAVPVYQSPYEGYPVFFRNGLQNANVAFLFEFVPAHSFKRCGQGHRCNTKPSIFPSQVGFDFDGMRTFQSDLHLFKVSPIPVLQGNRSL